MIRPIPDACIEFLADPEIENCVLHPYRDQKGRWTFGIGHLILPTEVYYYNAAYPATPAIVQPWYVFNIPPVDPKAWIDCPHSKAVEVCKADLQIAATAVSKGVKNLMGLNDNQYAALIVFTFNIGAFGFATSGCLKALNAGDMPDFFNRWSQWNKYTDEHTGLKVISNGLVKRRRMEQLLYLKAV